jgi:hypothetical protein
MVPAASSTAPTVMRREKHTHKAKHLLKNTRTGRHRKTQRYIERHRQTKRDTHIRIEAHTDKRIYKIHINT